MPAERPSGDTQASPPRSRPSAMGADPDAVAAVRHATTRFVLSLQAAWVWLGRVVGRRIVAAVRWGGPRLVAAIRVSGRFMGKTVTGLARGCWARRVALTRVGHRLVWWTALALLITVGRALVGGEGVDLWLDWSLQWFTLGLAMAAVVLLTASETRMRRAAFALAGCHGGLAILVWGAGL